MDCGSRVELGSGFRKILFVAYRQAMPPGKVDEMKRRTVTATLVSQHLTSHHRFVLLKSNLQQIGDKPVCADDIEPETSVPE